MRSDGTRSGVNWTRWKVPPSTAAVVLIVSVFARPGTPSIRTWPRASRQTSTRSSIASWPAMTLRTSNRACSSLLPTSSTLASSSSVVDVIMHAATKKFRLSSYSFQSRTPRLALGHHLVGADARLERLADGNARAAADGQGGGAERRCLALGRDLDANPEQVGLELHQEPVRGGAAVGAEDCRALGKGVDDVRDLVGDRLERRPCEMGACRPAGDPRHDAARVGIPPGGAEAR